MKKVFFFAFCLSLVFIFGVKISVTRAADYSTDTITPTEAAILNQELQYMKGILLEMQQIYANQNRLAALDPAEASQLQNALDTLQGLLNQVQDRIASTQNPLTNPLTVNSNLGDMKGTLGSINVTLTNLSGVPTNKELAQSSPAPGAQAQPQNISQSGAPEPANAPQSPLLSTPQPSLETAQAASVSNYEKWRWPVVAVLAIVVALGLWLWRRGEKGVKTESGIKRAIT